MIERSEAIRVAPELGPVLESLGDSWPYIVRWVYRFTDNKGLVYILCFSGSGTDPMYAIMTANVDIVDGALFVSNLGTYKCADTLQDLLEICPEDWSDIILPDSTCSFCGDLTCGVEYDCEATIRLRAAQNRRPSEVHGYRSPHCVSMKEARRWEIGIHEDILIEDPDSRLDVGFQLKADQEAANSVLEAIKRGRSVFEIGENLDD